MSNAVRDGNRIPGLLAETNNAARTATPLLVDPVTGRVLVDVIGGSQSFTTATFNSEVDDGNSGAADTIDWSTGNVHKSTITGNVTYTFTAPVGPCHLTLRMVHEASATSYSRTWPASVKWAGGAQPTWTQTTGAIDIVSFYFDGTTYYGAGSLAFA